MTTPGKGTLLQLEISSVFTTILNRVTLDGPSATVGSRETTDLDSSAKRYEPTIPDGGEVSGTGWLKPESSTHQAMTDLITTPENKNWKIIWANSGATQWPFVGHLTAFSPTGIEVESTVQFSFTIKLDGIVTYPT